jgi:hypothetical protein
MTRVEERLGFEISLEEPPGPKSLWAAVVKIKDRPLDTVQVYLACTRERALSDARGRIDDIFYRRGNPSEQMP